MRVWMGFLAWVMLSPLVHASADDPNLLSFDSQAGISSQDIPRGYYPVVVDETAALNAAVANKGLWVPLPEGGRIHLDPQRYEVHSDGSWSLVAALTGGAGAQKAVITLGDRAAFGTLPRPSGTPLMLTTIRGRLWLVDPALASDSRVQPEFVVETGLAPNAGSDAEEMGRSSVPMPSQHIFPLPSERVDVLVVYTSGFRSKFGSTAAALARINQLIISADQAFNETGVTLRLVHAREVNYPDSGDASKALADLVGAASQEDANSLSMVTALRNKYGADLVVLLQSFDSSWPTCGASQGIGYGLVPISTDDAPKAYSVVDDDGTSACKGDIRLAEAIGPNFGLVPDTLSNPTAVGVYPYSHAYRESASSGAYSYGTIMAQGVTITWPVFSNPYTYCGTGHCGVDGESNAVLSLKNTSPIIATFRGTHGPVDDVDADGRSDMFWFDERSYRLSYWAMDAATRKYSQIQTLYSGSKVFGKGDFDGDGQADLLLTQGDGKLWMYFRLIRSLTSVPEAVSVGQVPPNWNLLGTGDLDGDGRTDLIWRDERGSRISSWIMNGSKLVSSTISSVPADWVFLCAGDFNGDNRTDLLWKTGGGMKIWASTGSTFTEKYMRPYPSGAWKVAACADLDGDGKTDLIWRDDRTQRVSFWLMSDTALVRSWVQPLRSVWHLGAVGDYDDDGKADLIWTSDASVVLWTNVSSQVVGQTIDRYPTGWTLLDP